LAVTLRDLNWTGAGPEAREPTRKPPALQEGAKLVLHERGQAFAVAQTRRLRAEYFEVIPDNLIDRARGGTPRLVVDRRRAHATPRFTICAFARNAVSGHFERAECRRCAECAYLCTGHLAEMRETGGRVEMGDGPIRPLPESISLMPGSVLAVWSAYFFGR
jgi:hypothetical protein